MSLPVVSNETLSFEREKKTLGFTDLCFSFSGLYFIYFCSDF